MRHEVCAYITPISPMLSAVAARKAALAAAQAASTPESPIPSGFGSKSITGSLPQTGASLPKSKRKLSAQQARPEVKKAKKHKISQKPKPKRVSDDFQTQADVIVVDSESDDGSDSAMCVLEDFDPLDLPRSATKPTMKRAWSPSQPMVDSSDEDSIQDDAEITEPLDISSLLPNLQISRHEIDDDRILSTFKPEMDHNVLVLSQEECTKLGLQDGATVVGLNSEDTLCLLGTCSFSILHGSINVCGTTLAASGSSYPLYAPRSAPLPIIRVRTSSEPRTIDFPSRLQQFLQFRAVISFQELKTNVVGLGRICRSFEGVFEPSRWQRSSIESPFGISGLYLVCVVNIWYRFNNSYQFSRFADYQKNVIRSIFLLHGPMLSIVRQFLETMSLVEHISSRVLKTAGRALLHGL